MKTWTGKTITPEPQNDLQHWYTGAGMDETWRADPGAKLINTQMFLDARDYLDYVDVCKTRMPRQSHSMELQILAVTPMAYLQRFIMMA